MNQKTFQIAVTLLSLAVLPAPGLDIETETFRGVVTFQLLPAKVLKINKIIEHPKPGTSYIGGDGMLVDVAENPDVIANWTVVEIEYYKYPEPKTITYEIMSMQKEIKVNYHAVSVIKRGDLSQYIESDNQQSKTSP